MPGINQIGLYVHDIILLVNIGTIFLTDAYGVVKARKNYEEGQTGTSTRTTLRDLLTMLKTYLIFRHTEKWAIYKAMNKYQLSICRN